VNYLDKAFVFLIANVGMEKHALEKIKDIPEVNEAHMLYGGYDLIAVVEAENIQKLKDLVSFKMRRLENIRMTLTLIVVDSRHERRL